MGDPNWHTHIGIMTLPVAWVVFALHYTNRGRWLTGFAWSVLLAIPLAAQLLVWTNERHHLIWTRITLDRTGPFPLLNYDHGIGFWICNGYAHICLLAGTILLLGQTALAEDSVSVLMKERLADMTGKEGTVITVDYAPGAASDQHFHPGSVFAYVLEGAVVS